MMLFHSMIAIILFLIAETNEIPILKESGPNYLYNYCDRCENLSQEVGTLVFLLVRELELYVCSLLSSLTSEIELDLRKKNIKVTFFSSKQWFFFVKTHKNIYKYVFHVFWQGTALLREEWTILEMEKQFNTYITYIKSDKYLNSINVILRGGGTIFI